MSSYKEQAEKLLASAKLVTSSEDLQKLVLSCRDILNKIAVDQKHVGEIRKKITNLTVASRKASPKGKPDEGTVKTIKDLSFIFMDGSWYPYQPSEEDADAKKTEQEK